MSSRLRWTTPMGYRSIKRVTDVIGATILLVLTSPITVVAAGLVGLRLGRPVLYRQDRLGLGGRAFAVIKLRTMRDAFDAAGRQLPDDQRLTRFGRTLRATSIDELPQLVNVIAGDMSLIGPRPLFASYDGLYTPEQRRRHEVRPGLTGLAQVSGRNALSWEEKFALDVWYVDHLSFEMDLRIALQTIWHVISRRGVSQPGQATAAPFTGTRTDR